MIKKQGAAKTFFKDIIKLITSQRDVLPIENIMLHLRCRGLLNNTRFERLKTIMMGLPFAWLLNILMFPITLLSFMASRLFVISFATPFVPYWLDMISLTEFFKFGLVLWIILNCKVVFITGCKLFFDLADFITLGSLTEFVLYFYSLLPVDLQRDFLNHKNYEAVTFLTTTRQVWGYSRDYKWEGYFSELASKVLVDNPEIVECEVARYWEKILEDGNIYETQDPPSPARPLI